MASNTPPGAPRPVVVAQIVLGLRIGGLERVVVDLVNHAAPELLMPVVCLEERGALWAEVRSPRAEVVELHRRPGFRPWLALRLSRVLRSHRADLVHTHNTAAAFYGALAGRLCRLPVVHTKHGANLAGSANQGRLNRVAYALTDHVVAVSEEARRLALREGVPEASLSVVDNGVDTGRFRRDERTRRAARASLGIPGEAFAVGCVARLAPEKNHALLIESFSGLAASDAGRAAWLVLVGDGRLNEILRARAAALPAGPRIVFAGSNPRVETLLPAFDAFALASDSEGLPVALLEAMATGIPAVVTRVGAMPQVVEHGRTGLVIERGDRDGLTRALSTLLLDDALRVRLAEGARAAVVARYDAARMARGYEAIYSRLVDDVRH